jgi:penicillin-insensitive murein endopeptidase
MKRATSLLLAFVGLLILGAAAPSGSPSLCRGTPNAGGLHNGHQLQERAFLKIKHGSELNTWGHALLLQLVHHGARAAAKAVPGSIALVGDLSGPNGGALPGHASHQSGRDADVAFLAADSFGRPVLLDEFEAFGADGRSVSRPDRYFDAYRNWLMLRVWLTELRAVVTHVFVSQELRRLLLEYGQQSPEFVRHVPLATRVLQPHPNHADHFHVRIACPSDQGPACLDDAGQP